MGAKQGKNNNPTYTIDNDTDVVATNTPSPLRTSTRHNNNRSHNRHSLVVTSSSSSSSTTNTNSSNNNNNNTTTNHLSPNTAVVKRKVSSTTSSSSLSNRNSLVGPPTQHKPSPARSTTPLKKSVSSNTLKQPQPQQQQAQSQAQESQQHQKSSPLKRFGISPRFKRKIVETINKTNQQKHQQNNATITSTNKSHHSAKTASVSSIHYICCPSPTPQKLLNKLIECKSSSMNSVFGNSKLLNAFQSQWNLFTGNNINSLRLIRSNQRGQTLLSISQQRNSLRYASRRKYKTQSLTNPFRHANTNYPVYIHEALFMPEFSVKGKVTEADFEILDVISRGAFGHVIKVRRKKSRNENDTNSDTNSDDSNEEVYAMKIMWKSQVIRDRALQQVKDEVTIAYSCNDHPFIVKTWFYWQSKRFLYIITTYIDNGELLSLWLKVHHFPERLVAIYAIEMSLVLDYLHNKGIIYRDIKMENILLDNRGHVQLVDFGLSKWLKLGERTTTICGTIQYMGPEILSVEPYTHAVDWWSLGILMYAMFCGEYPLSAAQDHIQMCDRVSKHTFELDSKRYSTAACDAVRRLLRKDPHQRLKSLNEIKKEKFFMNEMQIFKQALGNSNLDIEFWNSNTIMSYYTPIQILFDEVYELRKRLNQQRAAATAAGSSAGGGGIDYIDNDDEDLDLLPPPVSYTNTPTRHRKTSLSDNDEQRDDDEIIYHEQDREYLYRPKTPQPPDENEYESIDDKQFTCF